MLVTWVSYLAAKAETKQRLVSRDKLERERERGYSK